jgi:hypothetical protein
VRGDAQNIDLFERITAFIDVCLGFLACLGTLALVAFALILLPVLMLVLLGVVTRVLQFLAWGMQ